MSTDEITKVTDGPVLDRLKGAIRKALTVQKVSAREASRRIGKNVGYVGDILEGRSKAPEVVRIMQLCEALEIPREEIPEEIRANRKMVFSEASRVAVEIGEGSIERLSFRHNHVPESPRIPLFVAKMPVNQIWVPMKDTPARMIEAHPSMAGIPGAYAVTVPNTLNEPRFSAGETVFVSPVAAVRPDDFVVAKRWKTMAIGRVAYLGDSVRIEVINADPLDGLEAVSEVPMADLDEVYRIVGTSM